MGKNHRNFVKILYLIPLALLIYIIYLIIKWTNYSIANSYEISSHLLQGVISGVITAFILFIFNFVVKANIKPWFENIVYKDTKVEGIWDGFLYPYIGIDEIDKIRSRRVFEVFEKERENKPVKENINPGNEIEAKIIDGNGEQQIEAKLLPDEDTEKTDNIHRKRILVSVNVIAVEKINIRVEIKRIGHKISGQIVEIGGASKVHTYSIEGTFKNLIFNAIYENENRICIDRGSLSLMLINNGESLSGFFSSYSDTGNCMRPMKCELRRNGLTKSST